MGKVIDTIHVPRDKVKEARTRSRAAFGRAGLGRKTSYKDRKKEAGKKACRKPVQED